jgi:hypothetical protein
MCVNGYLDGGSSGIYPSIPPIPIAQSFTAAREYPERGIRDILKARLRYSPNFGIETAEERR